MIRILCIESSTEVCSVAIVENAKVLDYKEDLSGLNHSKLLSVFIDQLLVKNQLTASSFNAVAVSEGPGSYTGLRIGVSVAKGFCYGAGLKLIAISPLKAMANYIISNEKQYGIEIKENDLFAPMIDARRMEVYCSVYNSLNETISEVDAKIIEDKSFSDLLNNSRVFFFGNGANKCKDLIKNTNARFIDNVFSSARNMAVLAHQKFNANEFVDVAYFEPFYLKDFVAIKSKKNILDL